MSDKRNDLKNKEGKPKWLSPDFHSPLIVSGSPLVVEEKNRRISGGKLREWWHEVLRNHGRYACYAFFLFLPSDKEADQYLSKYAAELDQVSNANCLIIALSERTFRRSGIGKQRRDPIDSSLILDPSTMGMVFREQTSKGYSVRVAELFGIKFTEFPCLVLFEDVRSTKRIVITLRGLTSEQIAEKMRLVFSLIQQAITDNINPLPALEHHQELELLKQKSKGVLGKISGVAEKSFETAMEAWIKAMIK